MSRFGEILGKGVLIVGAMGIAMQREQAITTFAAAVEAGDDADAERQIQEAARADKLLRDAGFTPPPPSLG